MSRLLRSHLTSATGALPFQKVERFDRELRLTVEQWTPDLGGRGEVRKKVAECLHREPAVVAGFSQGVECAIPRHAAGTGHAAVVHGNVDVGDTVPRTADRIRGVLLLDVGVEGIQMEAAVRVSDLVDQ